ncbi:hypothetical protein AB0B31_15170 [Catellatospora citrea]|uniref:hypothetical protein n=1 Tax=Catellatospora citrea TaxID=53366 RepID=UPI0033D32A4A
MEDRLLPVNAMLCLLLPNDAATPVLDRAGFRLAGLEIPAQARTGSVVIDSVLVHGASNHLVLGESKSGRNIEADQARKYAEVTPQDVVQVAFIGTKRTTPFTREILYLCLKEHSTGIRTGLNAASLDYPIMSVSDDGVELEGAHTAGDELQKAFAGGRVEFTGPPARLIPFDHESDVSIVKPYVLSALVAEMSHKTTQLTLTLLAERATPHYALYGRKARGQLLNKVREAVRLIVQDSPTSFEFVPHNGDRDAIVRILRTPESYHPRGRTQAYKAIGRPRAGRRRRIDPNADQLDLLLELGIVEEPSDDPGDEPDEVSA